MKQKCLVFICFALFALVACKGKKKISLSGDDPVEVSDFIDAFQPLNLPFQLDDTALTRKNPNDSLWISYNVFHQFVPDTVLGKVYGQEKRIKIYPIGKVSDGQNFLFAKAVSGNRWTAFLVCFDKKNNFLAGMPAIVPDANPATKQYFTVDSRMSLMRGMIRKNPNGTTSEARDVYVLNAPTKNFLLITTVNPDAKTVEPINPIDTFPKKNKFSGDYGRDPKNFVSVRDNKKAGRITFFIYLEKNDGGCTAELKGEASFTSANHAIYHVTGGPCKIDFNFTSSSVSISEENCGAHRGVDCLFQGSFPKKKEAKKPKKKK